MNTLFATWELDPLFKFGGLGDVARSLPAALKKLQVDIRTIMPYYKVVKLGKTARKKAAELSFSFAGKKEKVEIFLVNHPASGVPVYLLRNKTYLEMAKKADTFTFFDKAVVEIIKNNSLSFIPDIVHCNDHHTGLIPLLIKNYHLPVRTMMTIHNLAYQGKSSIDVIGKAGLHKSICSTLAWEIKTKQINFLMEGIIHADIVTTVSPSYGREIMTEEYGQGLDEVLKGKEGRVFGILNGIDIDHRKITCKKYVPFPYLSVNNEAGDKREKINWEEGKRQNKLFLQKKLKLKVTDKLPLISFIGRLNASQKGLDIMHRMLRGTDFGKYQIVLLGAGSQEWEERFQWLSTFYPKSVSCTFKFEDVLATQIYAASDFILIPSKYEPCGLVQMIAMYYGTLPIAHRTGGLADSIKNGVNGFLFDKYSSQALEMTVKKALDIWHNDRMKYRQMVETALSADFSWDKSAKEYLDLYQKLVENKL